MLKAIIFDFDGVIADTERLHFKALRQVLSEEGIELDWEAYCAKYLALDDRACFQQALSQAGREATAERIQDLGRQKAVYFAALIRESLVLLPGAAEFIEAAAGKYRLAIASGALRSEIEYILQQTGLVRHFSVVVSADDVRRGKPDPEPFLRALEALSRLEAIRAEECLAMEDSFHGIAAAKAAGMKCVAVTNSYPAEQLAEADLIVGSLAELEPELLDGLAAGDCRSGA